MFISKVRTTCLREEVVILIEGVMVFGQDGDIVVISAFIIFIFIIVLIYSSIRLELGNRNCMNNCMIVEILMIRNWFHRPSISYFVLTFIEVLLLFMKFAPLITSLALCMDSVFFLAVMLLINLMLAFFLTMNPFLFHLFVLLLDLHLSFMFFSHLVLGIFVRFGFLRLMFFRLFVFLLTWGSLVHLMRFGVVGWVNGRSTVIVVRVIEILTRIDRPSMLVIILEIGLLRIVVMLISVPAEVGVVIISSIRRHVIGSLRMMYWEVVLAVLEEFRD